MAIAFSRILHENTWTYQIAVTSLKVITFELPLLLLLHILLVLLLLLCNNTSYALSSSSTSTRLIGV
jgi:hypothetical protein